MYINALMRILDTVMGDMDIIFRLYYGMCVCRHIARYPLQVMYTQEKFEDTKEVLWSHQSHTMATKKKCYNTRNDPQNTTQTT